MAKTKIEWATQSNGDAASAHWSGIAWQRLSRVESGKGMVMRGSVVQGLSLVLRGLARARA